MTPAASDALSGLNSMPGSKVLGEGADQTVTFTVEDLAGNSASTTVSGISIDKTPPTIGASRTPDANNFGWNNTDVTARYSADDALSGLLSAPTGTFTFTAEVPSQSHTFTVEDLAGNTSAATIDAVSIDKVAPSISCSHADGIWHAADVTLPCTAADSIPAPASA